MIKQIEETFKIKLPQDYIKYMKENNGYTGDNYYDIWKLEDIIKRNVDYKVQEFFQI